MLRQWASYIAVPTWITDHEGHLLYFNEPVEPIIGVRLDEAGDMVAGELVESFDICDPDGKPLENYERPLIIALDKQMPAYRRIGIRVDGSQRLLDVTAIPLVNTDDRQVGAMATLWPVGSVPDPNLTSPALGDQQLPIELILTRQWASRLAVPTWLSDPNGNLLYYNEAAAALTGVGPSDGDLPVGSHTELFRVLDLEGKPLTTDDLPIATALGHRVAAHRAMRLLGLDGTWRTIEATALPLVGQNHCFLGGVALFWEMGP